MSKGWTQNHLSQISGIGLSSIQRTENGEVDARLYTLNVLQEKLNFQFNETHLKDSQSQLYYNKKKKQAESVSENCNIVHSCIYTYHSIWYISKPLEQFSGNKF